MTSRSAFTIKLGGIARSGIAGGNDVVIVNNGHVALGGATLPVLSFGGFIPDDAGGIQRFTIIDKQTPGAIADTFTGLPEGVFFTSPGTTLQITYVEAGQLGCRFDATPTRPPTGCA